MRPHPRIPLRSLLATLALCAAAPTQEGAILSAVAEAERAIDDKRTEDAILLLRDAAAALPRITDAAVREELQRNVDALRQKVDPFADALDRARADAANKLIDAARAYEARGWLRSALELLRRADRLAPDTAREALEQVLVKLGTGAATDAASGDVLADWFADGEAVDGPDGWQRTDTSMRAPPPSAGGSAATFLSSQRAAPARLRFGASFRADMAGGIGLVFAYRNTSDFHAVHVIVQDGDVSIAIVRYHGGAYATLAERWVPRSAVEPKRQVGAPAGAGKPPIRVELAVDGDAIEVRVGPQKLTGRARDPLPFGFLGLQSWKTGPDGFRPEFSQLAIEAEVRR